MQKYGYTVTDVPSMDSQIEACFPLTGDERVQCWADADKYMMENIVPVVPMLFSNSVYIVSDRIVNYTYSAYNDCPAFQHLAIAPDSQ